MYLFFQNLGLGTLIFLVILFLPPIVTALFWKKKIGSSAIRWIVTFLLFGFFWGVPFYSLFLKNFLTSKSNSEPTECQGNGDESFIRSKMSQMNRDILELNKVGERKYYVRYVSWSSGTAVNGDELLDYSNSPCND